MSAGIERHSEPVHRRDSLAPTVRLPPRKTKLGAGDPLVAIAQEPIPVLSVGRRDSPAESASASRQVNGVVMCFIVQLQGFGGSLLTSGL
jgi:hypothetical protein